MGDVAYAKMLSQNSPADERKIKTSTLGFVLIFNMNTLVFSKIIL